MDVEIPVRLLLTEAETASVLRVHRSTLLRLVKDGKAPVEPVWITPSVRRYRRADVLALCGEMVGAAS